MCCRYYMGDYDPEASMAAYYAQAQGRAEAMGLSMKSSGEVRPTDIAPVIAPGARDRQPGAYPMRWGFTYPKRKTLIFNTRSETAADKSLFAPSTVERRCLIPAECYFEWKKEDGEKIKYAIRPKDGQLYMAGLYFHLPPEKLPCFTVLTVAAAGGLEAVHERMPLMIAQGDIDRWLNSKESFPELAKYTPQEAVYTPA